LHNHFIQPVLSPTSTIKYHWQYLRLVKTILGYFNIATIILKLNVKKLISLQHM